MSETARSSAPIRHPLVDCRLDLLDRLLVGAVPRAERMATVARVEARIQELVAALPTSDPTDDEMLQVLSQTDSPEAVLSAARASHVSSGNGYSPGVCAVELSNGSSATRPTSKPALVSCGLAGVALLLMIAFPGVLFGIEMYGSSIPEVAYAILGTLLGVVALVSAAALGTSVYALWKLRRLRGAETGYAWATAGLFLAAVPQVVSGLLIVFITCSLLLNDPDSAANIPSTTTIYDPATGTFVERVGVDFDFSLSGQQSPRFVLRDGVMVPVGSSFDAPGTDSSATRPVIATPSSPVTANGIQLASHTTVDVENSSVELPPEPAPAHVDRQGPVGQDRCEGEALIGLVPVVVEPTVATANALFAESGVP
ncbi:MAG: hypothetical protein NT069_12305 [Planctomycetota bacterium]|nr:hypothetical protein [Planctomycetota bacterium]